MVMCWAPMCKHYNVRETCRFYSFPKERKERKERARWIKLVRRVAKPGPGAYVCSCHFVDGKRENGPTLFDHNVEKRFDFDSPKKRKRVKTSLKTSMLEGDSPETISDNENSSVSKEPIDTPSSNMLKILEAFGKMQDKDFNFSMLMYHEIKHLSSEKIKENLYRYFQRGLLIAFEQDELLKTSNNFTSNF